VIKSRRIRWARHVTHMGEKRSAKRILMGNPEGRRPFGNTRLIWEHKVLKYLAETEWKDFELIWLRLEACGRPTVVNVV
jgi:hypothetical protein